MSRQDPPPRVPDHAPVMVEGIIGRQLTYWSGNVNHCPGCGRTSWIIGRFSAECAFCRTALALEHSGMLGIGTFNRNHHVA
jgi:hypothetical protein